MRVGRRFSTRSNNDFSPDGSDAARSSTVPTAAELAGELHSAESWVGDRIEGALVSPH